MFDIPKYVKELIDIIKKTSHQCYLVGGYIRDKLLGFSTHDYDLTTDLSLDELKDLLSSYHFINKNGERHNTLTVHFPFDDVEITSFKHSDKEPNDLYSDATHRDFTINSIYFDERLIDPYSGLDDLKNKLIRAINPGKTFFEDPIRILRALRFSSNLDFEIEDKTKASIFDNFYLLENVSKERIRNELELILNGVNMKKVMNEYHEVIFFILPELKPLYGFEQFNPHHSEDIYNHTLSVVNNAPNELKIPALLHDIGKPNCFHVDEKGVGHFYGHPYESKKIAIIILKRFKFSKKDIDKFLYLIENHESNITYERKNLRKNLAKASCYDDFISLLKLQNADKKSHIGGVQLDINKIENIIYEMKDDCFNLKKLDISGNDLIELGYEGEKIGLALKFLLSAVIEDKVKNKKEKLIDYLKINF